jgi:hypothetical protein
MVRDQRDHLHPTETTNLFVDTADYPGKVGDSLRLIIYSPFLCHLSTLVADEWETAELDRTTWGYKYPAINFCFAFILFPALFLFSI